jgi:hypothetical protein
MSLPSRHGDAKRPQLLPGDPGGEALERPAYAIEERGPEGHDRKDLTAEAPRTRSEEFLKKLRNLRTLGFRGGQNSTPKSPAHGVKK